MAKVYIIAVQNMDGMVGRHTAVTGRPAGQKKIPFECSYNSLKDLDDALKRGSIIGNQLIFDLVPNTYTCRIKGRIELRLGKDNCGAIRQSTYKYIEADAPLTKEEQGEQAA